LPSESPFPERSEKHILIGGLDMKDLQVSEVL